MSLKPDHEQRARKLLAEAEACPDDPEAHAVARWMRQQLEDKPDPFAERMSVLVSDYALACMDEDRAERDPAHDRVGAGATAWNAALGNRLSGRKYCASHG